MTSKPLTVHIEPRPDGEVIAGRLCDGHGEEHQFTGWLGLLSLLEEARLAVVAEPPARPGAS
jgi:hypothetical protein